MGIQGLLPLVASGSSGSANHGHYHDHRDHHSSMAQFAHCTLGIDGHGWLHKALYGCATQLALGQPTCAYLSYFARRLRLLQSLHISPLVVLDGAPPPLKVHTNLGRRQRRQTALDLGRQLHAQGQVAPAERAFQSAVAITPAIVQHVIALLNHMRIPFVIAPYEADPQLVYLERIGHIDAILSEDSDLLVFGAQTLVTKWDAHAGTCHVVRAQDVFKCPGGPLHGWTRNMLVDAAILAGCDYLASAPGVGIKTAMRAVEGVVNGDRFDAARARRSATSRALEHQHSWIPDDTDDAPPYRTDTLARAIRRLQFQSSSSSSSSTTPGSLTSPGYLPAAVRARLAFRHARVWCPFTRRLVCLRPWPPAHVRAAPGSDYALLGLQDREEADVDLVGPWRAPDVAEQVAKGLVDPVTLQAWDALARGVRLDEVVRAVDRQVSVRKAQVAEWQGQDDDDDDAWDEQVDVFVEFEPDLDNNEVVIPASDDFPDEDTLPAPASPLAAPVHLPSPPVTDPSSSSESQAASHVGEPIVSGPDDAQSHPRTSHRPLGLASPAPLSSISALRHLPSRPQPTAPTKPHVPRSRKSAPAASTAAQQPARSADPTASSLENQLDAPDSAPAPATKRSWPTLLHGPPVPRVAGLFQARRAEGGSGLYGPPPVKRARRTG